MRNPDQMCLSSHLWTAPVGETEFQGKVASGAGMIQVPRSTIRSWVRQGLLRPTQVVGRLQRVTDAEPAVIQRRISSRTIFDRLENPRTRGSASGPRNRHTSIAVSR